MDFKDTKTQEKVANCKQVIRFLTIIASLLIFLPIWIQTTLPTTLCLKIYLLINFREEVLKDYRIVCESREASLLGRKEVLTGKAKFGIFGDGKEVAQVAMAKFFKPGISGQAITVIKLLCLPADFPLLNNFFHNYMLILM